MKLLYSDMLPLGLQDGQATIIETFVEQMRLADRVDIAVGYTSTASLTELGELIVQNGLRDVHLTIGMYFIEGMPEGAYHVAMKLNKCWRDSVMGEIRLIKAFKYHGKVYCFYKDGEPFSAIIGSPNLGAIKLEATNRRQYEFAALITDKASVEEVAHHIADLNSPVISENIAAIKGLTLIRETNTALNGIELVTPVPQSNVEYYKRFEPTVSFELLLKVPKYDERHMDDGKHFTKSNINVCYAAPRSNRKFRDWYETQLTVGAEIYKMDGYPVKNHPFFVITDDGYWFKAHTTSDNNKQFSAVGDELIMGRWLKGRLAAAGLIRPVNNTGTDTDRAGMITQEILDEYGCNTLLFEKTGQTALDEDGTALDVWVLSFIGKDTEE